MKFSDFELLAARFVINGNILLDPIIEPSHKDIKLSGYIIDQRHPPKINDVMMQLLLTNVQR